MSNGFPFPSPKLIAEFFTMVPVEGLMKQVQQVIGRHRCLTGRRDDVDDPNRE